MPSLFRDQAVALLARERLYQIRDELRAKRAAAPGRWSGIEARVLYLAEQATAATDGTPGVQPDRFPGVFRTNPGETASKFFTMGALGTTITAFGSLFTPDQDWVYRVLRKGTRDERRERVDAQSAHLALDMFQRAKALIDASTSMSDADKTAGIASARAFFLGHLCHVASGVVGAPMLDDMSWHLPGPPVASPPPAGITAGTDAKLSRDNVEGQIDQLLKQNMFDPSIAGSIDYASWLPSASDVPDAIYQAYADSIRALYLGGDSHKGFADLEAAFSSLAPDVSKDWIAEGFSTLRNVIGTGHDWGFWTWVGLLTPLAIPSLITIPTIGALHKGKDIGGSERGDERAWWEVVALQYAGTGLVLPLYILIFSSVSYRGFSQEAIFALVLGLIVLGFSIALLARLGEDDNAATRWTLLAVPVVLELFYAFIYILLIRKGGGRYNRLFAALFVMHIIITLLNVAYLAVPEFSNDLRDGGGMAFLWWALYAFVGVPLFVLGIPALILRAIGSFSLDSGTANDFLSAPRFAQLFDDSTLVGDPAVATPTLAQLYYPPGDADGMQRLRRKLLSLWWHNGTNDLYVRSRGDRLEFKWVATGGGVPPPATTADQSVDLPQAPMRLAVFAGLLGQVRQPAPNPGVLEVKVEIPDAEDHLLPEGRVLALGFEDDLTRAAAARQTARDTWQKLGDHPPTPPADPDTGVVPPVDDPGFPIYFATKAELAVAFGSNGDAVDTDEPAGVVTAMTGTVTRDNGSTTNVLGFATRFVKEIAAGDQFQTAGGTGVVVQVVDDTHLLLAAPATWLPPFGGAAVAPSRVSDDRRYDLAGAGTAFTHAGGVAAGVAVPFPPAILAVPLVTGLGTVFDQVFRPGDVIRIGGGAAAQERTVVQVLSNSAMQIDSPFASSIDIAGGSPYVRVGRRGVEGMRYLASAGSDLLSGATAMDAAADLAALLCLGGTSHVLTPAEAAPTAGPTTRFPGPQPIAKVYQCFRNWNLDRRRVNEWKMLVAGNAVSEKRGQPLTTPESMMITPEDGYNPVNPTGEAVALELGWVELLRRWLDVARRDEEDVLAGTSFRAGDPTNLELSRGLAFLLDLPDPAPGVT